MSVDTGQEPRFLRRHSLNLLISLGVLCILLFVPIWLLVDNYRDAGGVEKLAYGASLGAPRYDYFGTPVVVYSPTGMGEPEFCVTFEFLGLNQATSQVSLGILIDATQSGWQLLSQLKKRPHPPTTLTLLMSSTGGLGGTTVSFPLPSPKNYSSSASVSCKPSSVDITTLDYNALIRTTQSIFTLGTPRSFPDDWYELDDRVTLSIPAIPEVKVYSSLIMTSRDEDYSLSASVYQLGKNRKNAGQNVLEFTIRRPWLLVTYTYLIAAMPFFLLVAIFFMMHRRRHHNGEMPKHSEVAFGVTAALLAILPLRSVLVPSSVPSPTRLDFYFGLGTVGLVALSIIWVVFNRPPKGDATRNSSRASSDGSEGGTGGLPADQRNLS